MKEKDCPLCDAGFPLDGANHIPTQRLGMIPVTPCQKTNMKVVAYLRVSGKSQVEGDGFDRQQETIHAFCKAHNLELVRAFSEEGVSGTVEGLDRPAFSELLEWARTAVCPPQAIVVERMDRLARDLMVSEVLLKECRTRGLKVFAADQGALIDMASDGDDPTRKLIRQIMAALAEWEKSALVKKLAAARKRTGRFGGEPKYGSKPGEDRIILYLRTERRAGYSYERIAKTMNELGMRNRRGGKWDKKTIQRIAIRLRFNTWLDTPV